MQSVSHSIRETKNIAAKLARKIIARPNRKGAQVIALEGELGAGKTTFAQGFARALGIKQKVKSPTFLLIKSYPVKTKNYAFLYHIDCYRVSNYKELVPTGIRDILAEPANIVLVEWPERIRPILPKRITVVHIDHSSESSRKIKIKDN